MGNILDRVKKLYKSQDIKTLIIGLDAAGKTTLLYKLKLGEVVTTIPTIGFNVETINHSSINLTIWDVGGRNAHMTLVRHYLKGVNALILCVDSNDVERMEEVGQYLRNILADEELEPNTALLVFANKQDLQRALTVREVRNRLKIDEIRDRPCNVFGCSMTSGDGIEEGLTWLSSVLKGKEVKKMLSEPIEETVQDGQSLAKKYSFLSWLCGWNTDFEQLRDTNREMTVI